MTTRTPTAKAAAKHSTPQTAAKLAAPQAAITISGAKLSGAAATALRITPHGGIGLFITWHTMDFADKIQVLRAGLPAQRVGELSSVMGMPKEALMDSLGLSRATINRKVQREQPLSREESERVMGIQSLIGQVQAMVDAESAPEFDAAKWLARWLAEPLSALGGATPGSFMDTIEGQKYVANLLAMAQSGAYA